MTKKEVCECLWRMVTIYSDLLSENDQRVLERAEVFIRLGESPVDFAKVKDYVKDLYDASK